MSKILVVDDEPQSGRLLTIRLEEAGHLLVGASSTKDAKAALDRELFDLLICDVRLPDGSGLRSQSTFSAGVAARRNAPDVGA
jgi:DNA-binding response OmpR family regulator